jgi:hypothetical protein
MSAHDRDQQHDHDLTMLVSMVEFTPSGAFAIAGRNFDIAAIGTPPGSGTALAPVVAALRDAIYEHAFTRRFDGSFAAQVPLAPDQRFIAALSGANAGRERWDTGWRIVEVLSSGQLAAQKDGVMKLVWPGEFISADGVAPVHAGSPVTVYCPRESCTMQPSFYFAFGESIADRQDEVCVSRFYWNTRAEAAPRLIEEATSALNRFQVPFRMKFMAMPAGYWRLDAAVLYVPRRMTCSVAQILVDVHERCLPGLDESVPLFTRQLAHGLSFAEDPGNGESFGINRSRLVAEAVWQAHERGLSREGERLDEILRRFRAEGLDYARAHLGAYAREDYAFPSFSG